MRQPCGTINPVDKEVPWLYNSDWSFVEVKNRMLLDVSAALSAPGMEIAFELAEEVPPQEWNGDVMRFVGPMVVTGVCAAYGEHVMVRARVQAQVCAPCDGCLEEARLPLDVKLDQTFAREVDPEDPDLLPFEGHGVALAQPALAALFLEMPMRVLCRADCQGLCPVCGVNRNQTKCSCQKELPLKQPFSALASLLGEEQGE